jgi:hypothetical protein
MPPRRRAGDVLEPARMRCTGPSGCPRAARKSAVIPAQRRGSGVALQSRHGRDLTRYFPDLCQALADSLVPLAARNFARVSDKDYDPLLQSCAADVVHRFGGEQAHGGERHA